jgi:hypothetical protein
MFVGFSRDHSSNVPLVLNPTTGSITPQYQVVFDDLFSTVASIEREETPPDHWDQLCLDSFIFVPTEANPANQFLSDEWLTPDEQDAKRRTLDRAERIRDRLQPPAAPAPAIQSTMPLIPTKATTRLIVESTVPPTTAPPPAPPPTTADNWSLRGSSASWTYSCYPTG